MSPMEKRDHPASRRRKERANVHHRLRGVTLKCPELSDSEIRVVNISELGVGVEGGILKADISPERVYDCKLLVGKAIIPVKIQVVHKSPDITGMQFVEASNLVCAAVRSCFEPELVGASLKLSSTTMKAPNQTEFRFEGKNQETVELTTDPEGIFRFSITVLGNYVEWQRTKPLALIQGQRPYPVNQYLRKQLVQLVRSASAIPVNHRKEIETLLLVTPGPG